MKKKSSKRAKKQPFAKRSSAVAPVVIALLFAFNFAYSYAIGIPVARVVVDSYVESVYALGDIQVETYHAVGATLVAVASLPQHMHAASVTESVSVVMEKEEAAPEPLLHIAPNQISIAK